MSEKKNHVLMKAGAVAASAALAGSGAVVAVAASQDAALPQAPAAVQTVAGAASGATVTQAAVQGEFSYTQDAVSDNGRIASVFVKAPASLCASLPDYAVDAVNQRIAVVARRLAYEASVREMAQRAGVKLYQMTCACASNLPGGGAIANALVEGVSLESVAELAGVTR